MIVSRQRPASRLHSYLYCDRNMSALVPQNIGRPMPARASFHGTIIRPIHARNSKRQVGQGRREKHETRFLRIR
jgi:hypothetical protein